MSDDVSTPSIDDTKLFADIASDVKRRPDFYRDAGQWLDANYSDAAFAKRERSERSELLRKAKAGKTPEAKQLIAGLSKLRQGTTGELESAEAFELIVPYVCQKLGMSEERFAELTGKERTGHLAPDANLRPLTAEEKAKWPAMSKAEIEDWRKRAALTPEQRKQRDDEREELYHVYRERDRVRGIVDRYFHGDLCGSDFPVLKNSKGRRIRRSYSGLLRLATAVGGYAQDPPYFPTLEESKRILLLTWLLTDPEAHKAGLKLTELEQWPWDSGPDRDENDLAGRRFAAQWDWDIRLKVDKPREWLNLVRKAWRKVGELAGMPDDFADMEGPPVGPQSPSAGDASRKLIWSVFLRRPGLWLPVFWILACAVVFLTLEHGEGKNWVQKVSSSWGLLSAGCAPFLILLLLVLIRASLRQRKLRRGGDR